MPTLQNKIIIITGSTRGFGLATAQACLAAGATVAVTGRSQEAVDRALNGMQAPGKTAGFIVDVREEAQVHHLSAQVIQKFGHFDIWINNAGYSSAAGMVLDMNPHEALDMFMSNDLGAMHGTQAAMQHFLARKAGLLVNIYGNGSFLRPATPTAMYGTTKAWLTSFTRSLAKENTGSGVQILGFSPGMMTTDMLTSPRVVGEKAQDQMKKLWFCAALSGQARRSGRQRIGQVDQHSAQGICGSPDVQTLDSAARPAARGLGKPDQNRQNARVHAHLRTGV